MISSPRVLTADQVKATIEQGTEMPYQQATSSGATAVQFRKAALKLEVTPQITPEGAIIMDVDVNKDTRGVRHARRPGDRHEERADPGAGGERRHGRDRRHLRAAGAHHRNKVPLLGDLPVVGYLFKNTAQINDRTELLIFITPRVISEKINAAMR